MRSSKSRSRSKANRPRTLGNIVNRVFDSSGPEGKVRGTPQQIIEKYQTLARDAQLSNDRVAAENFLQHAEHYTRLLAEAMREMAAEQEARMAQQGQQNNWQNRQHDPRENGTRMDGGGNEHDFNPMDVMDGPLDPVDMSEQEQGAPRMAPRNSRPFEGKSNEQRPNNRPKENRPRDERPRDERPRDERAQDDRPRENRWNDQGRPPRNDDLADGRPQAAIPVFESPAAVVAQLLEQPAEKPSPKPRAPRVKRADPSDTADGIAEV